jgi:hypothetical protein
MLGETYPIEQFKEDMIQLLKASSLFELSFNRVAPLYHQYFGRQLVLAEYGCKELNEMLDLISDVVQVLRDYSNEIGRLIVCKPFSDLKGNLSFAN